MSMKELEQKLSALKINENIDIENGTTPSFEKKGGNGINLDLTLLGGSRPRLS
ncbi:hypothetical protein [Rossellomorea marisflavi]|uniref:hypothetical protein n=1 Tax=Rossellomorea marisflavi TaxID=189381 RepID=UPI000A644255|nr:hypothetical protein [Rossellomorea marisflavi]UKS66009.1 hypothetical protein K6T23_03815 [Rossellomorea marisflavi]USK92881.1 hypothetical protein LIT29_03800 [Rossellomorea marisflavi]VXC36711.1 conserved hypothetical protein [Bacillus sp. 349Y]